MTRYSVVYSKRANAQLLAIQKYITKQATLEIAKNFVDAVRQHCDSLEIFPQRGNLRDPLGEIRFIGFRKTVTIHFHILGDAVIIVAVHYRGRNINFAQ